MFYIIVDINSSEILTMFVEPWVTFSGGLIFCCNLLVDVARYSNRIFGEDNPLGYEGN